MLSADTVFLGIDPTAGLRPFTLVAFDGDARLLHLTEGELEDVIAFVRGQERAYVAINAPSRPNMGVVRKHETRGNLAALHQPGRGAEMRLAEHQLRERGIAVGATPGHLSSAPTWMQLGFALYAELSILDYEPFPTEGAPRQWLETHPHATFCALLGRSPLPRHSLEGRIQRQLLMHEQGLGIKDPMDFFDEITRHGILQGDLPVQLIYTPSALDTFAAAFTAFQAAKSPGSVLRLGAAEEGQIVLPIRELKDRY